MLFKPLKRDEVPVEIQPYFEFETQKLEFPPNKRQKQGHVLATCPNCGAKRWLDISNVRKAIKNKSYTLPACFTCANIKRRKHYGPEDVPSEWSEFIVPNSYEYSDGFARIKMRCPDCHVETLRIIEYLKNYRLSPYCLEHAKRRRIIKSMLAQNRNGRWIDEDGYAHLSIAFLNQYDQSLAKGMTNNIHIAEHRLVMARLLDRPLQPFEIVHHKDGVKSNNAISNLQLFVKKGHHSGYGSFYQEWQEALSEIERLKNILNHNSIPYS